MTKKSESEIQLLFLVLLPFVVW